MSSIPWNEEEHARAVVSHFLNASTTCVDCGGGRVQQHDFDALLEDGRSVAVEVTRWNDPISMATQGAIDKRTWCFPYLAHEWNLTVSRMVNVRALHNGIGCELAKIERAGVRSVPISRRKRATPRRPGRASRLCDLGVTSVYRFRKGSGETGRVNVLCEPPRFAYASSGRLVNIASELSCLLDNATKLERAADRSERHLFVWLEWTEPGAVASTDAFRFDPAPMEPSLPDHVDAVWLATAFESARVWRYSRSLGWEYLGPFPGRVESKDEEVLSRGS